MSNANTIHPNKQRFENRRGIEEKDWKTKSQSGQFTKLLLVSDLVGQ